MASHHNYGYAMKTHAQSLPHSQQGYIGIKPARGLQESDLLASALDEIACGVIITDGAGKLLHSNLAGQLVLERKAGLQLLQGHVKAMQMEDADDLNQALAKAAQGKRSMINLGMQSACAKQTTVALVPLDRLGSSGLSDSQAATTPAPRVTNGLSHTVAFIFSRTGMCEQLMLSFFSRAYQLTRSEEQILGLLCTGQTAPEMAQQLSVGEATVRTHIRNICHKTHSNGIRDVVKRLALLPPLMAAVMPAAFA
jgi:DNA-binding CsgD family transcriptional regulator